MSDQTLDELGPGELETDRIPVRMLQPDDLDAVVRIDKAATGTSRVDFYRAKLERALDESSVHTYSLPSRSSIRSSSSPGGSPWFPNSVSSLLGSLRNHSLLGGNVIGS